MDRGVVGNRQLIRSESGETATRPSAQRNSAAIISWWDSGDPSGAWAGQSCLGGLAAHLPTPPLTTVALHAATHRALKMRAARHNRSTEAEMRDIVEAAVRPANRIQLRTALVDLSRSAGLTNAVVEAIGEARDTEPADPVRFA